MRTAVRRHRSHSLDLEVLGVEQDNGGADHAVVLLQRHHVHQRPPASHLEEAAGGRVALDSVGDERGDRAEQTA